MRDGVYKNLPLPRPWKSLLRCCDREAERGETARRMAERAVESDAFRELTPGFLRCLAEAIEANSTALPGFSILSDYGASRDLGGQNSPLENDVLARAKRLAIDGSLQGSDLMNNAIEGGLTEWVNTQRRAMELHCLVSASETAARPALNAVYNSLATVDIQVIAKNVIAGERRPITRLRKRIHVDRDDLSSPL